MPGAGTDLVLGDITRRHADAIVTPRTRAWVEQISP